MDLDEEFIVIVTRLDGGGENFRVKVTREWDVARIKDRVRLEWDMPPEEQYILFRGQPVGQDAYQPFSVPDLEDIINESGEDGLQMAVVQKPFRLPAFMKKEGMKSVNGRRKTGGTLLHRAVRQCNLTVVDEIFTNKEFKNFDARDKYGQTALHTACTCRLREFVKIMLEHPKQFTLSGAKDAEGKTALHYAACWGDAKAVRYILEHEWFKVKHARLRDKLGHTALEYATDCGHEQAQKLIEGYLPPPGEEAEADLWSSIYLIQNPHSGRRLWAKKGRDGARGFGACSGDAVENDQKWTLVAQGLGAYAIKNFDSERILYAEEGQDSKSGLGARTGRNIANDQKWFLEDQGDGLYVIRNQHSGRRIFVRPSANDDEEYGATSQGPGPDGTPDEQKWLLKDMQPVEVPEGEGEDEAEEQAEAAEVSADAPGTEQPEAAPAAAVAADAEVAPVLEAPPAEPVVTTAPGEPSPAKTPPAPPEEPPLDAASASARFSELLKRSDSTEYRMPTKANSLRAVCGDSEALRAEVVQFADKVRPIVHHRTMGLATRFLDYKKEYGTDAERRVYGGLEVRGLLRRLLTMRPLMFITQEDLYLLRDGKTRGFGSRGPARFEDVGTDSEQQPLLFARYQSYEEMQLSALIGMSVPTLFINSGGKANMGKAAAEGSFEAKGIYVGLVGSRFERPNFMEWKHMVVTQEQNTAENGYGKQGIFSPVVREWANLYGLGYFPTYEEAQADHAKGGERFVKLEAVDGFLDTSAYRARCELTAETFLAEADDRAAAASAIAFCHVVALAIGSWQVHAAQLQIQIDAYASAAWKMSLPHIGRLHFSGFGRCSKCWGVGHGEDLKAGDGFEIGISFGNRDPAERIQEPSPSGEPWLLVAQYSWNSNSYAGNVYWDGEFDTLGEAAAACSSLLPELQNPDVNVEAFLGERVRVAPSEPSDAGGPAPPTNLPGARDRKAGGPLTAAVEAAYATK